MLDFGRYRGWTLDQIARQDRDFLEWLQRHPAGRLYRAGARAAAGPQSPLTAAGAPARRATRALPGRSSLAHGDALEDAQADGDADQRRAAVGDERQRDAGDGHDAQHHARR